MNANRIVHSGFYLALVIASLMLIRAVPAYALPPRPTPEPATESGDAGAPLELHLRLSPARLARWQTIWTVIQWQDAVGAWHDVEGWRGSLDQVVNGEGQKIWWVYQRDLGTGPFRWLVYDRPGGKLLAKSSSFNLPGVSGQTVAITLDL
jgi:hypothetical protein